MKKKGILGLIIVLVIVLLLGLVKFWIPGVIQRYDRQQHVDTTPDTLAYLFFGIGESENEGIDVHQAVLEQKTLDSFKMAGGINTGRNGHLDRFWWHI